MLERGQRTRCRHAQAGQAHPEERTPPFGHERIDAIEAVGLECLRYLPGRVAGVGERRRELAVCQLRTGRRLDAGRELGRAVEHVLKPGKRRDCILVEPLSRFGCELFQLGERS